MRIIQTGNVISHPYDYYGYFGWPTVGLNPDNSINIVCSGFRQAHMNDGGGKVTQVLGHYLPDEKKTFIWSHPHIVVDTPFSDDRDVGFHDGLVNWFTQEHDGIKAWYMKVGGFMAPTEMPAFNSHGTFWHSFGPNSVPDRCFIGKTIETSNIDLYRHRGDKWVLHSNVAGNEDTHEPHACSVDGHIIAGIRHDKTFSTTLYLADMAGVYEPLIDIAGTPPHFLVTKDQKHVLISVSWRASKPYGVRIYDFKTEDILERNKRSEGGIYPITHRRATSDCGYPSTVELEDGTFLTVYYIQLRKRQKCSIVYAHWCL